MWRGPGRDPAPAKNWPVGDVRNTASREHGGQGLEAGRAGRVLAAQPARPETQFRQPLSLARARKLARDAVLRH
jgi:hypothetical protein